MYAYCVIEYPVKTLDKAFTYKIPEKLLGRIQVGMKVKVPFGNQLVHGIVLDIQNEYHDHYTLKEIMQIEDEFFILNQELLELGKYLKELTLCNLITAYQTMLPSSLKIKEQKVDYHKYDQYVLLNDKSQATDFIATHRKSKKTNLLELLLEKKEINKKECDSTTVRELVNLNLIEIKNIEKYRLQSSKKVIDKKNLNEEQRYAFEKIKASFHQKKTFLLYGITGSGKTLIYLHLIEEVINKGKTALLLVPEISLTEQVIQIFYEYFGNDVAILHSGLSLGEKYDEYRKILHQNVHIVIGTRSAVFAPLLNIGIIIIDEEHSETYKQDNTPRYHALDIALKRSEYHHAPLVLGSATPSLEAMARAKKGIYELLTLKKRASGVLPTSIIVDMKEEIAKRNFIISEELDKRIKETLERHEQVALLLNRRGYSTIITCSNCGFTYKCPYCEISLTYHKTSNMLRCHYCGYTKIKDDICPKCQEKGLNYMGTGTEKLESMIIEKYSKAKVIRMDADTTSKKQAYNQIIQAFRNHEYDILIGTQMISKGLDFPNCTLVGIINADTSLNMPDFRSNERTFALLTQTSGRAGRSIKKGNVIIQTFNPDNMIIKCAKEQNYEKFYQYEMQIRRVLKYPPYFYLVHIKIASKNYELASNHATKVATYLKRNIDSTSILLGPSTANHFRLKNIYRFNITIKYRKDDTLKKVIHEIDEIYSTNKDVFLEIDFNPLSL